VSREKKNNKSSEKSIDFMLKLIHSTAGVGSNKSAFIDKK
jgi:hypothetical protein